MRRLVFLKCLFLGVFGFLNRIYVCAPQIGLALALVAFFASASALSASANLS